MSASTAAADNLRLSPTMSFKEVVRQFTTSARRSRSGGTCTSTPCSRWYRIHPKPSVRHQPRQRTVGGHDDPGVDATGAGAADALDGQVLDGAQQLRLRRGREVRHLVEEQRAFMGVLELAAPAAHARRRALFDAEQLCLEQCLDDRRTVDRDEGALAGGDSARASDERPLLAAAALAFDEDGEIGRRDPFDALADRRMASLEPIRGAAPSVEWCGDAPSLTRPMARSSSSTTDASCVAASIS